jgi:hypothetical protein
MAFNDLCGHVKAQRLLNRATDLPHPFITLSSTDLICNIAQNIPEFLDMVESSLHRDKNEP